MSRAPRTPYGNGMTAYSVQQLMQRRHLEPLRNFCAQCEHSEFIHGDFDARRCLYTECACSGFTLSVLD
jgi:hypothetical protein